MRDTHIRLFVVLFAAFALLLVGATLTGGAMAQSGTDATIEYNYTNESVEYELSENLFSYDTPYNTTSAQLTTDGPFFDNSNLKWNRDGTELLLQTSELGENVIVIFTPNTPYDSHGSITSRSYTGLQNNIVSADPRTEGSEGGTDIDMVGATENGYWYGTNDGTVLGEETLDNPQGYTISDGQFVSEGDAFCMYTEETFGGVFCTSLTEQYDITSGFGFISFTSYADGNGLPPGQDIIGAAFANDHHYYVSEDSIYETDETDSSDYTTYENPTVGGDIDFINNGLQIDTSLDSSLEGRLSRYNLTLDVSTQIQLESNGQLIDNTQQIVNGPIGSIAYESETYSLIYLTYETLQGPTRSGQSNTIAIYGDGNISIRDEQTNALITDPVNVTAYGDESGIYSLDTSDGSINITGLPDQSYTFSTSAPGYETRNKYVDELGNVENLYLLSNETDTVTSQFLLEDTTNTFGQDSRLIIERSIEGNGNDWEVIYSDTFGVEGVTATLQEDVRYRISLENDETLRTIGPYRATVSETVTIQPDSGDIEIDSEGTWSIGANYNDDHINARFNDPEDTTDTVSITIYERGNESNTIVDSDTFVNPQDLRTEYVVPQEYNQSNWIVSFEVTHSDETTTVSMQVGPTLDTVPADLDPMWRNIISIIVVLTFGLAFSVLNRAVGAIVLALVGGALWWVGWLAGATAGVLIMAYLFIAIGYGIYTKT